jgi:hypothetical protein
VCLKGTHKWQKRKRRNAWSQLNVIKARNGMQ